MIPPSFDYYAPKTLPEAISIINQNADAKILAGGQSLIPLMRFRLASPAVLVDINRLEGLGTIQAENGWLRIGALAREAELERSALVREGFPLLMDTTRSIADPLVRNQATVGGNLAHADPANDHPAAMLAYAAEVVATGTQGERSIPIADFFLGPFESALAGDEILTEIRVPYYGPNSGGAYFKLERKVGDFATAGVAVQIALDGEGVCTYAGIGLTNVGLTPIKPRLAEDALKGTRLEEADMKRAAQLAADAAEPIGDQRGSEEYKRALVKTLTVRALRRALERARGGIQ
jgi:carbon-monoxide dehydrogenase medium subunit